VLITANGTPFHKLFDRPPVSAETIQHLHRLRQADRVFLLKFLDGVRLYVIVWHSALLLMPKCNRLDSSSEQWNIRAPRGFALGKETIMRDLNPNTVGLPDNPKATRGSTWRPRAKDEDIITNNNEGAPPVPIGQPGDREQGSDSDGPMGGQ